MRLLSWGIIILNLILLGTAIYKNNWLYAFKAIVIVIIYSLTLRQIQLTTEETEDENKEDSDNFFHGDINERSSSPLEKDD